MSWNYRIIKSKYLGSQIYETEEKLEIMEVHYNKEGKPISCSDADAPYGESKEELKECLDLMYKALEKDILDIESIS